MIRRDVVSTQRALQGAFGGRPFSRAEADELGISGDRLASAVRSGVVARLRRGRYAVTEDPLAAIREQMERHEARGIDAVIGERTAADLWGVAYIGPVGALGAGSPTLLVPPGSPVRVGDRSGLRVSARPLLEGDVVEYCGLRITSPLRTGVDMARLLGRTRAAALTPLCSGLRREGVLRALPGWTPGMESPAPHDVTAVLRQTSLRLALAADLEHLANTLPCRGLSAVRRVLPDVEPLVETAVECIAWSLLTATDLPRPVPQAWLRGRSGKRYRVDFLVGTRVILEVDGAVKYAEQTPWQEKQRQSDLEAAGYWVVRCTWDELMRHPDHVIARLLLALARSAA